ncbi:MAG TPA: response regulator transcription factor [Woeseiaceae bacterium]|nr:response regulator transcription factor [Woeseiaceae bacterium]
MVDDDHELCRMVVKYLTRDGFDVTVAHRGRLALEAVRSSRCDVMILDVMMPGMNGHDVLREIAASSGGVPAIPVLMLTARGDEIDRVLGLEIGADDYLAKPCSLRELAARLRAILRRTGSTGAGGPQHAPILKTGDITLNRAACTATRRGRPLSLTSAEFAILRLLMESAGMPVTKDEMTQEALGRHYTPFDRSIDVHIGNLRRKLSLGEHYDALIKTVRGRGYLLAVSAPNDTLA